MDTSLSTLSLDKLYALHLTLRPLERGTLMPFSGELVQNAWLDWIRGFAPDVAAWLHDGNKHGLFTCSSLQSSLSPLRIRDAERSNIHIQLDPKEIYSVRVTLLLNELFPLFYDALLQFNREEIGTRRQPFMQIGKQVFLLEEVGLASRSDWAGFTSFSSLVDTARQQQINSRSLLTLEFSSLTTFNRTNTNTKHKNFSSYYARLPLPLYIFPGLARRWQELAPAEFTHLIHKERIEQYIQDDGIIIEDYELRAHQIRFINHQQRGFLGTCVYHLQDANETKTDDSTLSLRQQIFLLAHLAFYTGVGYKPVVGMGQCRCLWTA